MATNPITGLNGVNFFSVGQDGGGNLGADNLSITTIPESGTILSFLSGSFVLGAVMLIRRRRA